jgi:menaquinone-specific isochorismate synthase
MSTTSPRQKQSSWDTATTDEVVTRDRLVSCAIRATAPIDTFTFLRQSHGIERFYWNNPYSHNIFAGIGLATELFAWGQDRFSDIHQLTRQLFADAAISDEIPIEALPRLMGGFAFNDDFVRDDTWSVFHPAHFVLPHIQFTQIGDETWLTMNALIGEQDDPSDVRTSLRDALQMHVVKLCEAADSPHIAQARERGLEQYSQINYPMSFDTWTRMINHALSEIENGRFKKVVLARVCELRHTDSTPIDHLSALERLNNAYPSCIRFLFEPRPRHAFIGATPELLVGVHGLDLNTMAMAGSAPRGQTAAADAAFESGLLQSAKERREHQFVVDMLRERLTDRTTALEMADRPVVLKLSNIQHLYTPIQARLRKAEGALMLTAQLHPTPALGGAPRDNALTFMRANEPVTRGWYGAPVGWVNPFLDGEFCVAIRSAVTQVDRAWLYAGCGIVADSQPDREWDESALKFKPMLQALNSDA